MRLALQAADDFPTRLEDVKPFDVRRVRELGFSGIGAFFGLRQGQMPQPPSELTPARCRRVRNLFADEGVVIAHSWAMWAPLMHPDEATRKMAVRTWQESCRIAVDLGTDCLSVGPGSASEVHGWAPHRENFTGSATDRLIASLREGMKAAEDYGVTVSLKGHVLTTVNTPERARQVADAVASPRLVCGVDPVNWMTLEHVYEAAAWIEHVFTVLGGTVGLVHAKDVVLEDNLVTHLTECPPGQGVMDYERYLGIAAEHRADGWVVLEHVPKESVPAAREHLLAAASAAGVKLS